MASEIARAKLSRAALALNASYPSLPHLILVTDEKRLADPLPAVKKLPRYCAIILRHSDPMRRGALAEALKPIAHANGLRLLIAGDAELGVRVGAHGLHLPEARLGEAAHWKALHPSWLVTVAVHSATALARAALSRADAALLAPVFPTRSHPDRSCLGASRTRLMAQLANIPTYALGGVNAQSALRLSGARMAGIAAIEGLSDQSE